MSVLDRACADLQCVLQWEAERQEKWLGATEGYEEIRRQMMPVVSQVEAWRRQDHDDDLFGDLCSRAGRIHGPALLYAWWRRDDLSADQLRDHLVPVWSAAEFPEADLGRHCWVELFRYVKYRFDGASPLTVYRGAAPYRRKGMSWTTDQERARWFAGRCVSFGAPAAYVYRTTLTPFAILCDADAVESDGGRRECEIVVDPGFLEKIERIEKITAENHEDAMAVCVERQRADLDKFVAEAGARRTTVAT